jgi:hypothetical protein
MRKKTAFLQTQGRKDMKNKKIQTVYKPFFDSFALLRLRV